MLVIPLPLLILVFYALLDKDYITNGSYTRPKEHTEVEYTIVASGTADTADTADNAPDTRGKVATDPQKLHCDEKVRIGLKILPFIIPLFLSFFAEYLSNSSVITTIAFPKVWGASTRSLPILLAVLQNRQVHWQKLSVYICLPPA